MPKFRNLENIYKLKKSVIIITSRDLLRNIYLLVLEEYYKLTPLDKGYPGWPLMTPNYSHTLDQ